MTLLCSRNLIVVAVVLEFGVGIIVQGVAFWSEVRGALNCSFH
jgi:hypothetical protein